VLRSVFYWYVQFDDAQSYQMYSAVGAAAGQCSSLDEKIARRRKMKQKTDDDDDEDIDNNDEAMDVDEAEISSSNEHQLKQGTTAFFK